MVMTREASGGTFGGAMMRSSQMFAGNNNDNININFNKVPITILRRLDQGRLFALRPFLLLAASRLLRLGLLLSLRLQRHRAQVHVVAGGSGWARVAASQQQVGLAVLGGVLRVDVAGDLALAELPAGTQTSAAGAGALLDAGGPAGQGELLAGGSLELGLLATAHLLPWNCPRDCWRRRRRVRVGGLARAPLGRHGRVLAGSWGGAARGRGAEQLGAAGLARDGRAAAAGGAGETAGEGAASWGRGGARLGGGEPEVGAARGGVCGTLLERFEARQGGRPVRELGLPLQDGLQLGAGRRLALRLAAQRPGGPARRFRRAVAAQQAQSGRVLLVLALDAGHEVAATALWLLVARCPNVQQRARSELGPQLGGALPARRAAHPEAPSEALASLCQARLLQGAPLGQQAAQVGAPQQQTAVEATRATGEQQQHQQEAQKETGHRA